MSIRQLPKAPALMVPPRLRSEIAPSVLARWDATIRAADEKDGEASISILGAIGDDFFGNGVTARRIAAALRAIGDRDVVVYINSPGGDYFEGLAIYNLLREHPRQVTVKVLGIAASAASVIAMAGDRVEVPRAGFLMIHNTWVVAVGDRNDLRDFADTLEPFDNAAADVYAARSGLDAKEIHKMMDRETYIGGQEAVDKGFADDLLPADRVAKDAKAAIETGVFAAIRRIDLELLRAGMPRVERRRLLAELKAGTPSAAEEVMPSAGLDVNGDLLAELSEISIR
jgi:ATP-dependent Clp protease protease subunit